MKKWEIIAYTLFFFFLCLFSFTFFFFWRVGAKNKEIRGKFGGLISSNHKQTKILETFYW